MKFLKALLLVLLVLLLLIPSILVFSHTFVARQSVLNENYYTQTLSKGEFYEDLYDITIDTTVEVLMAIRKDPYSIGGITDNLNSDANSHELDNLLEGVDMSEMLTTDTDEIVDYVMANMDVENIEFANMDSDNVESIVDTSILAFSLSVPFQDENFDKRDIENLLEDIIDDKYIEKEFRNYLGDIAAYISGKTNRDPELDYEDVLDNYSDEFRISAQLREEIEDKAEDVNKSLVDIYDIAAAPIELLNLVFWISLAVLIFAILLIILVNLKTIRAIKGWLGVPFIITGLATFIPFVALKSLSLIGSMIKSTINTIDSAEVLDADKIIGMVNSYSSPIANIYLYIALGLILAAILLIAIPFGKKGGIPADTPINEEGEAGIPEMVE